MENNLAHINTKKLLFLVAEDWYFCSHRLPLAVMAKNAGYEVAVATRVSRHGVLIEEAGLRLISLKRLCRGSFNPFREFSAIWELLLIYRRERPDLVHHVAVKPVLYGSIVARLTGVPGIVNALAGLGFIFSSGRFLIRCLKSFLIVLFRLLLKDKKGILIVQNSDDRKFLIDSGIVNAEEICLIRGAGVDVTRYCVWPQQNEVPVVMLAARMLWDKGVGEFVEAAREVKRCWHARFVLVGDTDAENPAAISRRELESWHQEGVIEWWGHRDNMPNVISQADIVCLPSYHEGLPKVLLEAMACGKAIVATDIPGCRDVVRNDENGKLVPMRDSVALANAIEQMLGDKKMIDQMGVKGRQIAESEFSVDVINTEVLRVYEKLIFS